MERTEYEPSRYNFILREQDGSVALYNTKTGALAAVESHQAEAVLELLANPRARLHPLMDDLATQGFLVPVGHDELDDIRTWVRSYLRDKRLMHLTLLPAEACNFACPYCFQYNRRNVVMANWVYDAVFALIDRSVHDGLAHLKLGWFGGEPTLAANKILQFMHRLAPLAQASHLTVQASIVTNGYRLTPSLLTSFVEANIRQFQVTLDGAPETHDRLRYLKSGKPTFSTIYENLLGIVRLDTSLDFNVAIRANFLRTTIDSARRLLDMFVRDFGHDRRFTIYFRPVYRFETTRNSVEALAPEICTLREGLELQAGLAVETIRELNPNNLFHIFDPLPRPIPSWCPAERAYSYTIGAGGEVYTCDTLVGDEVATIGRLGRDGSIEFREGAAQWHTGIFDEIGNDECLTCKLLPICLGGCKRGRLASGKPACFWREQDILWGMRQYLAFHAAETTSDDAPRARNERPAQWA
jgi:uncharacterized protein